MSNRINGLVRTYIINNCLLYSPLYMAGQRVILNYYRLRLSVKCPRGQSVRRGALKSPPDFDELFNRFKYLLFVGFRWRPLCLSFENNFTVVPARKHILPQVRTQMNMAQLRHDHKFTTNGLGL